MMNIGQFPTFLPHFPFRDAQQLYNTRFDLECQQFFQKNLQLFSSLSVLPNARLFLRPVPCPACRWPELNRQTTQKAALRGDFPQGGNCSA